MCDSLTALHGLALAIGLEREALALTIEGMMEELAGMAAAVRVDRLQDLPGHESALDLRDASRLGHLRRLRGLLIKEAALKSRVIDAALLRCGVD